MPVWLEKIGNKVSHSICLAIIGYFLLTPSLWYLNHRPILGVDFYNTATYVKYLTDNFSWRFNGWKDIWWSGQSMEIDYPTFYFYLIIPLAKFVGPVQATLWFMVGCLGLFFAFVYLSFWRVSQSKLLGVILTIAGIYSVGVWGSLVWGGSLPYFVSQCLLPLILFLVFSFLYQKNKKNLVLASLITSIAFFGHPQVIVTYVFPFVFMLLFLWKQDKLRFFNKQKFKDIFLYFGLTGIIIYPITIFDQVGANLGQQFFYICQFFINAFQRLSSMGKIFSFHLGPKTAWAVSATPSANLTIEQWQKNQLIHMYDWTNPVLFWIAGGVIGLFLLLGLFSLIRPRKMALINFLPFLSLVFYIFSFIGVYGYGVALFQGGWFRVFWPIPLVLGWLISWFWRQIKCYLTANHNLVGKIIYFLYLLILVAGSGYFLWQNSPQLLTKFDQPWGVLTHTSSAYPNVVNMIVNKDKQETIKQDLIPGWLDPERRDYRLLEVDAQVNIWWNSIFSLPLARGYIDPKWGGDWVFWLTSAVFCDKGKLSQLVDNWKVAEKVALNNALFMLDWYSVKFLEADHPSDVKPQISAALLTPEFIKQDKEVNFAFEEELLRLKADEKTVSSPVRATNLPQVLYITPFSSYEPLANFSLSQPKLEFIPLHPLYGGEALDQVLGEVDLTNYDAIYLSNYSYLQAADNMEKYGQTWEILNRFVQNGGRLVIAGGKPFIYGGVIQDFPDPWPFSRFPNRRSTPESISSSPNNPLFQEIDLKESFQITANNPLVKTADIKKIFASNTEQEHYFPGSELRSNSQVIASLQGIPLIVQRSLGKGKVVWLWQDDPQLVFNSFTSFFQEQRSVTTFTANSEKLGSQIKVEGKQAKGIFITKGSVLDWSGKLSGSDQELAIYGLNQGNNIFTYLLLPKTAWQGEYKAILTNKKIQKLHFYELNDELVTPILQTTNTPAIGVVASTLSFATFVRALGLDNINSQKIIPLHLGSELDRLDLKALENLDALILYGYDYKNHGKGWSIIDRFVNSGGKVWIETGSDVKETDSSGLPARFPQDLPSLFPLQQTRKGEIGNEWHLSIKDPDLASQVKIDQFDSPVWDQKPWQFSLVNQGVRGGAKILLENQGEPLIVSRDYGKGKVIWSGMNLFYHAVANNNLEEGKLVVNLVNKLTEVKTWPKLTFSSKRINGKKAVIEGSQAKGILFKERFHPGWEAKIISSKNRGKLTIYPTGPNNPGFMYVRIPQASQQESYKVSFVFKGTFWALVYYLLSWLIIFLVLDYSLLSGRLIFNRTWVIYRQVKKKIRKWWLKDEDY